MSGALVATTARTAASNNFASLLFVKADLGTPSGVAQVVDRIAREWGGSHILVNNFHGTDTIPRAFGVRSRHAWHNLVQLRLPASAGVDRAFMPRILDTNPHS